MMSWQVEVLMLSSRHGVIKLLLRRRTNKSQCHGLSVSRSVLQQHNKHSHPCMNISLQHWSRVSHVSCCYAVMFLVSSWLVKKRCPPPLCPLLPEWAYTEQGGASACSQSRCSLSFALCSLSSHTHRLVLLNGLQEGPVQKLRLLVDTGSTYDKIIT